MGSASFASAVPPRSAGAKQVRLLTLFAAMLILSCGFTWLRWRVKYAIDQRRAVETLEEGGAVVMFFEPRTWLQRNKRLQSWLGDAAILVVQIVAYAPETTDATLADLQGMKDLPELALIQTQVTEAGIEELKQSLPNLRVER